MLYIFHVDTGTTITFDIQLALQSVAQLKEAIERECGVIVSQQVLLMSGGESLEPHARVCSYSAGTDTNPIYLFSKTAIESHMPPVPNIDYGSDVDLHSQIESSLAMSATYQTVSHRAQLAQQCCALARELTRICEKLVHDQHLQQQGWAAVVANLEDITQVFQTKADFLQHTFAQYLVEREQHMQLLQNFSSDLSTLEKIPILPALRANAEGFLCAEDELEKSESVSSALSLLKWISAKDNQSSLEQVAEQCAKGLEQFDERVLQSLKDEVLSAIEGANSQNMKEIKGLGERLFALEELMTQARRLVLEQGELAQGFLQNQNRANNLGDPSVLPDLCTSHRRQLMVMLENHNQLRDIRKRCTKAKEELSMNINQRLKWIMYVENKIMEVDGKLVIYNESLRRLRRHMEVLQQIHLAPEMYLSAISEVVRRRTFSKAFMVWASELACQLMTVHSEELARRKEFQGKFEGHFLNTLFPGMEDTPPPYATTAPSVFDNNLPKLTVDDMETLKQQLPDLALSLSVPDLNNITQFFLSKSLSDVKSTDKDKDKSSSMTTDVKIKRSDKRTLLDERGTFGSETDTEEFEKICQDGAESNLDCIEGAKQLQKQLEENLVDTRDEVERLRNYLQTMKSMTCEAMIGFRKEILVLRESVNVGKRTLKETLERVRQMIALHAQALEKREQELSVGYEMELNQLKDTILQKDKEIDSMKEIILEKDNQLSEHDHLVNTIRLKMDTEKTEMRNGHLGKLRQLEDALHVARLEKETLLKEANDARVLEVAVITDTMKREGEERIKELEASLEEANKEQQRLVKEATDKLHIEYKTELETIRSRFKLMAASAMERSPSESSLEKIERSDLLELVGSGTMSMHQGKEESKLSEEGLTVEKVMERERMKMNEKLQMVKQIIDEKCREIEEQKAREKALLEECEEHRMTIRRFSEWEKSICQSLNEKVENLKADKCRLKTTIEEREHQVHDLEVERDELRQELNEERLKMNEDKPDEEALESSKEDIAVSESKKVRLESDNLNIARRLELLEVENRRLNCELRSINENKSLMEAKLKNLEADKVRLELELIKERQKICSMISPTASHDLSASSSKEMAASIAVMPPADTLQSPKSTGTTSKPSSSRSSPVIRDLLTRSAIKFAQECKVSTTSCNRGDVVLVLWDDQHMNYILLQQSTTFYFLNSESLESLDLKFRIDGTPKRTHAFAEVVDKEYCHARKHENRYRVPKGTKFYRVRVRPMSSSAENSFVEKKESK